jgi:hypothetical protein
MLKTKAGRIIYWHSLGRRPEEEQFLADSLRELGERLQRHLGLTVSSKKLPKKYARRVVRALRWERRFINSAAAVGDIVCDRPGLVPGVIVGCPEDLCLARDAREADPDFIKWGARCGRLAMVWKAPWRLRLIMQQNSPSKPLGHNSYPSVSPRQN